MTKVYTLIAALAVVSLGACKPSTKTTPPSAPVSAAKPVVKQHKDSVKAEHLVRNYFPADTVHYPLDVLTEGIFHDGEVDPKLAKHSWKGLFKTDSGYYVADAKLEILKAHDDVLDDAGQNTGWEVKTNKKDTSVLLISGLKNLADKDVKRIVLAKHQLLPGEHETFVYNATPYTLYATGVKKEDASNPGIYMVSDYKLFLKVAINGKQYNQLLVSSPAFDDALTSIIFAGDIDDDGIPDFIIDTASDYNSETPTLYLSRPAAADGDLLKVMGLHSSSGC